MPHVFTWEEASALLPRLQEILDEMQQQKALLDSARAELASMTRAAAGNGHLVEEKLTGKQGEAETVGKRLNTLLAELTDMGCELKGLEQGLIDFPAERDGHPVYLCWRLGEEQITFWHEMDTGFASRQPL